MGTVDIEPRNGTEQQTHAGALALNDKWVFVDGPKSGDWHTIRKYSLTDLRKAMETSDSVKPDGEEPQGLRRVLYDHRRRPICTRASSARKTATGCTATRLRTTDP